MISSPPAGMILERLELLRQAQEAFNQNPKSEKHALRLLAALRQIWAPVACQLFAQSWLETNPPSRLIYSRLVIALLEQRRFGDAVSAAARYLPLPTPNPAVAPPPPTAATPAPLKAPSAEMVQLAPLYEDMHRNQPNSEGQYEGLMGLAAHGGALRQLTAHFGIKTALDYGGGKGLGWAQGPIPLPEGGEVPRFLDFAGLETVDVYDPGAGSLITPVAAGWDATLCFDVLEHVPEQDVDWVLEEIFAAARKAVMLNIALYPAVRTFPDGRNVHITLKSPEWWNDKLDAVWARHPHLRAVCYFSNQAFGVVAGWLR